MTHHLPRLAFPAAAMLALLAVAPLPAQQPDFSQATAEAMAPMQWWVGRWEGKGWSMTPDRQRLELEVVEIVESRIDGQVLVFEGIGTDPATGHVGHHALGVLSFDGASKSFRLRTFRSGGVLDPDVEILGDGTLIWGFPQGPGRVRFTVEHTDDDLWREIGEYSPDGQQWFQMLGMELSRVSVDDD